MPGGVGRQVEQIGEDIVSGLERSWHDTREEIEETWRDVRLRFYDTRLKFSDVEKIEIMGDVNVIAYEFLAPVDLEGLEVLDGTQIVRVDGDTPREERGYPSFPVHAYEINVTTYTDRGDLGHREVLREYGPYISDKEEARKDGRERMDDLEKFLDGHTENIVVAEEGLG